MSRLQLVRNEAVRLESIVGHTLPTMIVNKRLHSVGGRVTGRAAWGVFELREIAIAGWLMEVGTDDEIIACVRHEYAHYMANVEVGGNAAHGHVWKRWARKFGDTANRCYSADLGNRKREAGYGEVVKYHGWCPTCRVKSGSWKRQPRTTWLHKSCRTPLRILDAETVNLHMGL